MDRQRKYLGPSWYILQSVLFTLFSNIVTEDQNTAKANRARTTEDMTEREIHLTGGEGTNNKVFAYNIQMNVGKLEPFAMDDVAGVGTRGLWFPVRRYMPVDG